MVLTDQPRKLKEALAKRLGIPITASLPIGSHFTEPKSPLQASVADLGPKLMFELHPWGGMTLIPTLLRERFRFCQQASLVVDVSESKALRHA